MFKMEIFDDSFNSYGQINKFSTATYTKKFNSIGSFQIYCPITEENIGLLSKNRIVWFEDNIGGIIQYIDKDSGQMTIKGNLVSGLLKTRCIYPTIFIKNMNAAEAAATFVYKLFVYGEEGGNNLNHFRMITNFEVRKQDYSAFGLDKFDTQATGVMLDSKIEDLGQANNFGFDIGIDPRNRKFVFEILKSTDRSINQAINMPVILSSELQDILSSSYTYNESDYSNAIFAAGQGEGESRKWVVYDVEGKKTWGFDRKEYFVDARDISDQNEDGTTMPITEYNQLLMNRAIEKSSDLSINESYNAEISDSPSVFTFGKDYFLGDKITVEDKNIGVQVDAQISEYTRTFGKSGTSTSIVYGYNKPFLLDSLRRKGVI